VVTLLRYLTTNKAACAVVCVCLVLAACEEVVRDPLKLEDRGKLADQGKKSDQHDQLVWPHPPAEPKLAYVLSFSRPADLGIKKGLVQQLGELISGPRNIHLVRPMAIAVGPAGEIYVADPGVQGVHKFDMAASSYQLIQRENGRTLPSPVALTIGPDGEVYVSDSLLAGLFVIGPGAKEAVPLPLKVLIAQPTGVAVDPRNGRIYLVDTGDHKVKVFSRDGTFLKNFGRRGTGDGEFNFPTMIWRNENGHFLITDSMNFRIQVFDENGQFLYKFGQPGSVTGTHAQPKGIATDSEGHVYVVDSLFHTMQVFDPLGQFLLNIGRQGQGKGEFWLPTGIFIGKGNTIYVADSFNARIQIFRYIEGTP
jgi:DNA-binding beta-propeller fold protein YncE